MNPLNRFYNTHIVLDAEQADQLRNPETDWNTVEARPPKHAELPAVPVSLIDGIREMKTKWLGLRNTSPALAFEIRRDNTDQLSFQYSVPTNRLERKLRNHLADAMPDIELREIDEDGIPVTEDDSLGGGTFSLTQRDWNPLKTSYDEPPTNPVIGTLHQQAMQDTKFVVQVLFRSVAGKPLRRLWDKSFAHNRINQLRDEKEQLIGRRKATATEKQQAKLIDQKINQPLFEAELRVAVIGAGEHTPSRIHELSGAYNRYNNSESGQSFKADVAQSIRSPPMLWFGEAVATKTFGEGYRRFRVTAEELAALVALPDRTQNNLAYAKSHDS